MTQTSRNGDSISVVGVVDVVVDVVAGTDYLTRTNDKERNLLKHQQIYRRMARRGT